MKETEQMLRLSRNNLGVNTLAMLRVTGLKKSFGIDELFHDVSFEVARGDKVGFVGANGAGKTTLMRCLLGQEETDGGTIQLDEAATIGYVEQQADFGTGTLYEEFLRAFDDVIALGERKKALEKKIAVDHAEETMKAYSKVVERFELLGGYDYESRIRRVAFGLGFTEEDFEKNVAHFSGGQKTRICLTKALLREPDFLFLDEPTNHLDIASREWVEDALEEYEGALIFVSHDRYFVNKFATRIWELEDGHIRDYLCGYEKYRSIRSFERIQAAAPAAKEKREKKVKPAAPDKSLEKQLRAIEREIEKQEALLHEYDGKIDAAASDYQELSRLMAERETAENAYAEMMERWEALSLRLEGAE